MKAAVQYVIELRLQTHFTVDELLKPLVVKLKLFDLAGDLAKPMPVGDSSTCHTIEQREKQKHRLHSLTQTTCMHAYFGLNAGVCPCDACIVMARTADRIGCI